MKRRQRPRVAIAQVEEVTERQVPLHEQLAALRRQQLSTSAHDTGEPTPCCICGGPCEPAEVHWGPWRRHQRCESVAGDPIGRLVAAARARGRDLSRSDAALVLEAGLVGAKPYSDVHDEPTWSTEPLRERLLPWRHVDRVRLADAVEKLPVLRAEAGLVETSCVDGPCAWCGVREALGLWASREHHWADGSPAPLCAACVVVYDRAGELDPSWWEGQRAVLAEALTGVPVPIGTTPPTVRAYAEAEKVRATFSEAEKGRTRTFSEADGTPWSHLPAEAVTSYRWTAWALYGGKYAPPEHRAEALERAREADAAKAARHAAILAEEAQRMDVYGFGGAA